MPPSDHDFRIRRLEQQLNAARASSDAAWEDGYRTGRRDRDIDIPTELASALRHGSAQEHVSIPIDGDELTVILAHDGDPGLSDHAEARAWERLQHVYRELTKSRAGMDCLLHLDLPRLIAAVVRRNGEHVALVVNKTAGRAHLKAVLRSGHVPRGGGVVLAIVGAAVGRHVARGAAPAVAAAAVTAAAVTAVAMPHIIGTGPRPSASAPAQPGPLGDDAYPQRPAPTPTPVPSRSPSRPARPGGSVSASPPVLEAPPVPALPSRTLIAPPGKVRTPKHPVKAHKPKATNSHPAGTAGSASGTRRSSCLLKILRVIALSVCGRN